ncbi:histidine kinase, partial [Nocardia sp. NPDC004722]
MLARSTGYLFLVVYVLSVVFGGNGIAASACAIAQAALLVAADRWRGHYRSALLAQGLATYLPIVVFGPGTVDLDALLAATIALGPRGRWVGFGLVALASGPVHHGWHAGPATYLLASVGTAAIGLVIFSLLRLPGLVDRLDSTRDELTRVIRSEERLRVARDLRAGLGAQLVEVAELLHRVRADLTRAPGLAGRAAEEAAERTRAIVAMMRRTAAAQHELDLPARDTAPVTRTAPRLALATLAASMLALTANQVFEVDRYPAANALGGLTVSTLLLAQVIRPGLAGPLWWTQLVVTLAPLPWLGPYWALWLVPLAVAALLRERVAWASVAVGCLALRAVFTAPTGGLADRTGWVLLASEATLVLFGLARFHQLSVQLNRSRAALAARTAHLERLRLARDIHDLLGLTLSVLALKCDLIGELITRDPRRAESEIAQALRIAADARL